MNLTRSKTVAAASIFMTASLLLAGCAGKDKADAAPGAAGAAGKPTPEQEAAKSRGESQGAAIEAANRAAQSGGK